MKHRVKKIINNALGKLNLKLVSAHNGRFSGQDLAHDLPILLNKNRPLCLDIGSNKGQTIDLFNSSLDQPIVHAFEPSSEVFALLKKQYEASERINLHQLAMGSRNGKIQFNNLPNSQLSSVLKPTLFPWTNDQSEYQAQIEEVTSSTVDAFLERSSITQVDLLKSDVQGFDFEVLKGAKTSLVNGSIKFVLIELNFFEMYENQGQATQMISFLEEHGLFLIDFYEKAYKPMHRGTLSWCTALFGRRDP